MVMETEGHPKPSARVGAGATTRAGPMLALWMSLTIALQGVLWLSGFKQAALVGAIGEALVGPVSPTAAARDPASLVTSLVEFCIRSVTAKEPAVVNA